MLTKFICLLFCVTLIWETTCEEFAHITVLPFLGVVFDCNYDANKHHLMFKGSRCTQLHGRDFMEKFWKAEYWQKSPLHVVLSLSEKLIMWWPSGWRIRLLCRSPNPASLPLLKRAFRGQQLATILAVKRSAGVAPEVSLIYHVYLQVWIRLPTLDLKPREDVTKNPKQGYQWLHKRTCDMYPPESFLKNVSTFIRSGFGSINSNVPEHFWRSGCRSFGRNPCKKTVMTRTFPGDNRARCSGSPPHQI